MNTLKHKHIQNQYDVAVLGGGPGGYVAAIRAAQLGLKTIIIEKDKLGGVCLNWGCIPTKSLLKNAEVLHTVKHAKQFGITIPDYSVDFSKVINRSRSVSDRLSKGVQFLMKKNGIDHLMGRGVLTDRNTIEVTTATDKQLITATNIILATGGRSRTFPGIEIDGDRVINSRTAMVLESPPKTMIIIGAGAIGVEFAYFYNTFGSKVHLIEMLDRVLPVEDKDVSLELEKSLKKSGIKVYTKTKVSKIDRLKTKVKIHTEFDSKSEIIEGDIALVAVGVTGNIENIGLEKVGIKTDRGAISIDEYGQTNVSNIYAIGDVTGPPWLAHVASAQGHVAAEHIANANPRPVDYTNIPGCTYCQPQVASLGLTEEAAKEKGHDIKVGKFMFRASGKAMATGDTNGFVKIIFDAKYGELLGCHIIGPEATELIAELGVAKALETTWEDIATTIHAHPTLSEAIMEAAMDAFGQSIHQ